MSNFVFYDIAKSLRNMCYEIDLKNKACHNLVRTNEECVKVVVLHNPIRYYVVIHDWAFLIHFFDYNHEMPEGIDLDSSDAFVHIAFTSLDKLGKAKFPFSVKDWRKGYIFLQDVRYKSKGLKFNMLTLESSLRVKDIPLLMLSNRGKCFLNTTSGVLRIRKFNSFPVKVQGIALETLVKDMVFGECLC